MRRQCEDYCRLDYYRGVVWDIFQPIIDGTLQTKDEMVPYLQQYGMALAEYRAICVRMGVPYVCPVRGSIIGQEWENVTKMWVRECLGSWRCLDCQTYEKSECPDPECQHALKEPVEADADWAGPSLVKP